MQMKINDKTDINTIISYNRLSVKYPPSDPCSCDICKGYCVRPGWWTVEEAKKAIEAGFANRMMLEISPEQNFGVLSPAFKGNEGSYALEIFSANKCTFLKQGLCELFGTGNQPLECRFCHHTRKNAGKKCHLEIEKDWNSIEGKKLIVKWGNKIGFWNKQGFILKEK
jgi:hypothetical protein